MKAISKNLTLPTPSCVTLKFEAGVTYSAGDCGTFSSDIDVTQQVVTAAGNDPPFPTVVWGGRIQVFGSTHEEAAALRNYILCAIKEL